MTRPASADGALNRPKRCTIAENSQRCHELANFRIEVVATQTRSCYNRLMDTTRFEIKALRAALEGLVSQTADLTTTTRTRAAIRAVAEQLAGAVAELPAGEQQQHRQLLAAARSWGRE